MVRNIYLSVSAFVFAILSTLIIWQGTIYSMHVLAGLNWLQILFYLSLSLVIVVALTLTNSWIVLGNKSPILSLWLQMKQFISKITWKWVYKCSIWLLSTLIIIVFTIGCFVSYLRYKQFQSDIRLSGKWHTMYLAKAKYCNNIKALYDEQSVDYADAVNSLKKHFSDGAKGHP